MFLFNNEKENAIKLKKNKVLIEKSNECCDHPSEKPASQKHLFFIVKTPTQKIDHQ